MTYIIFYMHCLFLCVENVLGMSNEHKWCSYFIETLPFLYLIVDFLPIDFSPNNEHCHSIRKNDFSMLDIFEIRFRMSFMNPITFISHSFNFPGIFRLYFWVEWNFSSFCFTCRIVNSGDRFSKFISVCY